MLHKILVSKHRGYEEKTTQLIYFVINADSIEAARNLMREVLFPMRHSRFFTGSITVVTDFNEKKKEKRT